MSGAPTVAARAAGSSTSMPAVRPVPSAEDPPKHRTGPNAAARALAGLPEGSLCFVPVRDEVLDAVRSIAEVVEVVDDTTWPRWALAATSEVPLRVWFVVQLEDPSRALGFALRRVEEGSRVLLGTRTRTRAGARRMLLGTSTPALGQAWLDAVPRFALHEASSGWELVPD